MTASKRLTFTQVRSPIGFPKTHAEALKSLGLRRIRHTVEVEDTPAIRGQILKVRHLIEVADDRGDAARGRA